MPDTDEARFAATYASILVAVDLTPAGEGRIKLAGGLARRFGARLVGAAGQESFTPLFFEFPNGLEPTQVELEERQAAQELQKAESVFRRHAGPCRRIDWHAAFSPDSGFVTRFLARQAHVADLIVIGQHQKSADAESWKMAVDPGDLTMTCGRPILVVPPKAEALAADRVVIGWRDTREARRAVWDSLPFLKRASDVFVVTIGETGPEPGAADVSAHLRDHGVNAHVLARPIPTGTIAEELLGACRREGADLLVSGAYGHSRMREWIFGGVTRDLLAEAPVCCLMSH